MKKFKKVVSVLLCMSMVMGLCACTSDSNKSKRKKKKDRDKKRIEETEESEKKSEPVIETIGQKPTVKAGEKTVINLWSFTDEVPQMVDKYITMHPEFAEKYEVIVTIKPTIDGAYQPALDMALAGGGDDAPDMYCVESAFALKYTQGDMSFFAASYDDLGIDTDRAISDAGIIPYVYEVGTRPSDGEVVALGYQGTQGAFIYRRSIAIDVFGTDDPAEIQAIIGGGTHSWDKFYEAAATLGEHDIAIVSGDGDIWHSVENSATSPWVIDDTLVIDPMRELFFDHSMLLTANGWSNGTSDWTGDWFNDIGGIGDRPCFGFFGPAWFINYTMQDNCGDTFGDWAICLPPEGFFWGGTWIMANDQSSPETKEGVRELIEWITLDTSETGLQYMWANGTFSDSYYGPVKDTVCSTTVMAKSNGSIDFLGGQNMFDIFVPAASLANGTNLTQYDEYINLIWRDQVRQYVAGDLTKEEAIEFFKSGVAGEYGIGVN